ncbi:anthranilate synthase component I family protein [Acinetobacter sp. ANC 4648]|uniref:anthranilate synthase component I family protein n=1 Tax=Acinetobacter sp. ANC 4648 TaxID=1977875 RepID=UPI000A32B8A0|nr:anthranilate synthase component I family protein [Acinetobacter sp. ANC 4648]OTG79826.1 aminodeoxychorismate synthase component I [Acinetobacter sp. ANC 4648]
MLNTSFFKKSLIFSESKVSDILKKLDSLFGCVYLENNEAPIVAFLPSEYCIYQHDQFDFYTRTNLVEFTLNTSNQSLKHFLKRSDCIDSNTKNNFISDFQGGYIGFIDYNFSVQAQVSNHFKAQPNLFLGIYKSFLKFEDQHWIFYSTEPEATELYALVNQLVSSEQRPTVFELVTSTQARWSKDQYQQAFLQVQEYIKAGDCYQINLTQEFTAKANGALLDTAEQFWQLTNAPYSGYLKVNDFELLSCSPELFINFEQNQKIVTKPIKGTMPRYQDPILDLQSKNTLANSQKDQAENVMIVDLLRNDLSLYAETGSVKTPKLFEIESFNQVHHMISEVTATLKKEVNPFDVLLSALPGGSITGAPKIRAMQIIEELEGAPRGAYCGSMGYFNFDGTGSWNILIRSIQKYQDEVSLWAGGGITIASNCDAEYQECFDKVSAMLDLFNTWHKPE